jgi:hypothetical protein
MSEKILYYLGAGASANALPLAKSIWDKSTPPKKIISGLADELETFDFNPIMQAVTAKESRDLIGHLEGEFKALALKANEFGDVDTYAKFLNLMQPGGEEIKRLKQTLSQYFSLKQIVLNAKDSRYLPWLVSIMNNRRFPENVKILTWNYDFQVELAAAQIGGTEEVEHDINSFLYSPSMLTHYPNIDPTFSDHKDLSLIHLNGIAGIANNGLQTGSVFQAKNKKAIESTLTFLSNEHLSRNLFFAWDNAGYFSNLAEHVKTMIEKTTILVVIGYSFPFFNREVDKQIFRELTHNNSLRKIYYQDPVLDGEQLRDQFLLKESLQIVHIKGTSNFHIPYEY